MLEQQVMVVLNDQVARLGRHGVYTVMTNIRKIQVQELVLSNM